MKYGKYIDAMNKKVNTVILLIIVLIIWGLVVFRIWKWLKPEQLVSCLAQTEAAHDMSAPAALILDYRDPFLSEERSPDKTGTVVSAVERTSVQPPSIKYKGILRGKDGVKRAVVECRGEISTPAAGESVSGMKIREITPESIAVIWDGQLQIFEVQ